MKNLPTKRRLYMSDTIKILQQVKNNTVDVDTGEIISQEETTVLRIPKEPDYIKLYLDTILYLSDLPGKHSKVLNALLKRVPFANSSEGGMVIALNGFVKKQIAAELQLKNVRSLDNSITEMVKGEILFRLGSGTYLLNPHLFGRGNWSDIQQLRLTVDFSADGKTFSTVCKYKNSDDDNDDGQMELDLTGTGG